MQVEHALAVMLAIADLDAGDPLLRRRAGKAGRDEAQQRPCSSGISTPLIAQATSVSGASAFAIGRPRDNAEPRPSSRMSGLLDAAGVDGIARQLARVREVAEPHAGPGDAAGEAVFLQDGAGRLEKERAPVAGAFEHGDACHRRELLLPAGQASGGAGCARSRRS